MDTEEFLGLITPKKGNKIIAVATTYEKDGQQKVGHKYIVTPTAEAAAEAALQLDGRGETVFYGVNGFGGWYKDDKSGKNRLRTQVNVVACRSLYDDFDVAKDETEYDTKYENREEAMGDIVRLSSALRIVPTVVNSGRGYHCYFPMDEDITPEEWASLSLKKRAITTHLGMKVDRAVDMDCARVLRPVGTHNRKGSEPLEVKLVKLGKVYSVESLHNKFDAYIEENSVAPASKNNREKLDNPFAAALPEYQPSSAVKIAEHCRALKIIADAKGDVEEPLWYGMLGLVKATVEGRDLCHEWSSGHPQYDKNDTDAKIDQWVHGPTSCEYFNKHLGCKEICPHAKTTKFPITLGYGEESMVKSNDSSKAKTGLKSVTIDGETIPYWPDKGYSWNNAALSKLVQDADGVNHWIPFCRSLVYPLNRIRGEDGTWKIHWRAREHNGSWRDFFMPTSELASTDQMAKTFASNEVFLHKSKHARTFMSEFSEGMIERLQAYRIETKTYNKFGWTDNYDGFVMGTDFIGPEEALDTTVLCSEDVPRDIAKSFGVSGSLEDWIRNIDVLLNRNGAEVMQFALCHAMGSSLVEIMGSSNWHGIPFTLIGDSGEGKSTISKIACGFYGNPSMFGKQGNEDGTTLNALIKRICIMGSLPSILDEMSGRSPDDLTRIGYALVNGEDKERMNQHGKITNSGDEWFKNTFTSSNESIHETIANLPAGYKVEATQLRFFEVVLPPSYLKSVFPDVTRSFVEHHMDSVYGTACRPFLRFVMKNRDWVRRQLVAARDKFNRDSQDESKERFYADGVITAMVAGKIAQKLGLIQFNVKAMSDWAFEHIKSLRENRKASKVDIAEHAAQFFASLHGRMIVTQNFHDGRSKTKEIPTETLRQAAVGRIAHKDKRMFVSVSAMTQWCKENRVIPSDLKDSMDRAGLLVYSSDGQPTHRIYLGSGTNLASSQARCYEFDYDALFGSGALLKVINKPPESEASDV